MLAGQLDFFSRLILGDLIHLNAPRALAGGLYLVFEVAAAKLVLKHGP
jgi:hypothetical protein